MSSSLESILASFYSLGCKQFGPIFDSEIDSSISHHKKASTTLNLSNIITNNRTTASRFTSYAGDRYRFGFERPFDSPLYVDNMTVWMQANWTYSFLFAAIYLTLVFVGRRFMKNRPRYELRTPLIVWNITLAAFSILGTVRVWPEFFDALVSHDIVYSVCNARFIYSISGFWGFVFCMSKLPELIDTLFIVLRKQVHNIFYSINITLYTIL